MASGFKTGGRVKGTPNRRTAAVEAAAQAVAERFKAEVPTAFAGDGISYLQTVYRDPSVDQEVRIDAAAKAARYERPQLAAIAVQQQTSQSQLDLKSLTPAERDTLATILTKAMRSQLVIDGAGS